MLESGDNRRRGVAGSGKTCDAIIGIIDEGKSIIKEFEGRPSLDAGLVAAAQAVELRDGRYGTRKAWAQLLSVREVVALLDQTLGEETKAGKVLSQLRVTCTQKPSA